MNDELLDRLHFTTISPEDCFGLLTLRTSGHVAFTNGDGQQLVPVNFVMSDRTVYFRTAPDSFLATLAAGNDDVAFATGHQDDLNQKAWSVTVKGATSLADESDLHGPLPQPWASGERDVLIRLQPASVDGRRVRLH